VKSLKNPPASAMPTIKAICLMFGSKPVVDKINGKKVSNYDIAFRTLLGRASFFGDCANFNYQNVTSKAAKDIKKSLIADGQEKLEKVSRDFK